MNGQIAYDNESEEDYENNEEIDNTEPECDVYDYEPECDKDFDYSPAGRR